MVATITATAEPELARVRLQVDGAPVDDPAYIFRRDRVGTSFVRETSGADIVHAATVTRRNRVTNPYPGSPATTTGWAASYAPGGAGTITNISGAGGPIGGLAWRATWTTASTASNAYLLQGSTTQSSYEIPVTAGEAVVGSIYARTNKARTLHARIYWLDAAGNSAGGSTGGTPVAVAANTWARLTVPVSAVPAGAVRARLGVQSATGEAIWAVGDTLDVQGVQLEGGTVATPWFWGQFAASGTGASRRYFRWAGTQYASASEEYATQAVAYDYEARQGLETDYVATDPDGGPIASTRVVLPAWGTWLKHPGKPFLNTKVHWHGDKSYTRAARRTLLQARGAKYPAALSDRRTAPTGGVQVATIDDENARQLTALIDDGQVLMIDVDVSFGVPVRYVSVGDVKGDRADDEPLFLDWQPRLWTLEVDEVAPPLGTPAGQSFSYELIPALYDSYLALSASVETYADLSIGQTGAEN